MLQRTGFLYIIEKQFKTLYNLLCTILLQQMDFVSLVDEGGYWLTAVLNICVLERIQTAHSWFWDLGADKTFTTRWPDGIIQV